MNYLFMNEIDDSSLKNRTFKHMLKTSIIQNHQRICMHVNSIKTNRIHCNAYNKQHFLAIAYYTMVALLRYVLIGMMWVLGLIFLFSPVNNTIIRLLLFLVFPAFGLYLCAFSYML